MSVSMRSSGGTHGFGGTNQHEGNGGMVMGGNNNNNNNSSSNGHRSSSSFTSSTSTLGFGAKKTLGLSSSLFLSQNANATMRLRPLGGVVLGESNNTSLSNYNDVSGNKNRKISSQLFSNNGKDANNQSAGDKISFGSFAKGAGFGIKMMDDEVVKAESEKIKYVATFLMQLKPLNLKAPATVVKNFPELIPSADDSGMPIKIKPVASFNETNEVDNRDWRSRTTLPDSLTEGNENKDKKSEDQWGHKGYEQIKIRDEMRKQMQDQSSGNTTNKSLETNSYPAGQDEDKYSQQPQLSSPPNVPQQAQQPPTMTIVADRAELPLPEIKKTKNAWRPGSRVDEKTKLMRNVRDILNKLTPEKFEKLVAQVLDLNINSPENLQICIVQVFEKAVAEPHFTELYADLCAALSKKLPEFTNNQSNDMKPVTFRRVLLNTCQEEFEGTNDAREKLNTIEDEALRSKEDEKVKRRTLGNIRLIGELYKKQMLQEKIVHVCITELLQIKASESFPCEENIEALCHLLSTVGKQVDSTPRSKALMNSYIKRLLALSSNQELHSRLRFMCKDVADLRESEWIPRRKKETAKKLKDIHVEAEKAMGIQSGLVSSKLHSEAEAELFPSLQSDDGWVEIGKKGKATANPDNVVAGNYSALVGTAPVLPERVEGLTQSHSPDSSENSAPSFKGKVLNLNEEEREKKILSMIQEYLSSTDINEAVYCVEELGGSEKHGLEFANKIVSQLVEAKSKDAKILSNLITGLVLKQALSKGQVLSAIAVQTANLDDLVFDAPLAPRNIGELIASCEIGDIFSVSEITHLLEPVTDARHKRACFAFMCDALTDAKSESFMVDTLKASGVELSSFLAGDPEFDESVSAFLRSKSLSVLL